jgi:(E)-4-hydroxy-3-methylbut-2-enyl-diphosphate synthase
MLEDFSLEKPGLFMRRPAGTVRIGNLPMGSDYPVRLQSMANTLTGDVKNSVEQCVRIIQAGAEYVRFTVPSLSDVEAVAAIRNEIRSLGFATPLIADVHFNPEVALQVAPHVDKVRVNPGNFADLQKFEELIDICREHDVAIRIGVNHGSLSERMMKLYGDTPEGMAQSAMEFLRLCRKKHFDQAVVSMKASNVRIMIYSTRLITRMMAEEDMQFPLHLGVTEAGEGEDGRIKSAVGIGTLLAEGLGDTIRVSLTEEPEHEIPVAQMLIRQITGFTRKADTPYTPGTLPEAYHQHTSRTLGNIGGNNVPVVVGYDALDEGLVNLIYSTDAELSDVLIHDLSADPYSVLVYRCTWDNVPAELRNLRWRLERMHCEVPVIIRMDLNEKNPEEFMLRSAASLGGAFIEGFGDGIWLTNSFPMAEILIHNTALGILQACRARMSKTEYISCPSCGRTHFNLMETVARIKAVTSHLKGLKIGIMGCIVNGPGEMADADYGYVGAGQGKITLYKSKTVVKKAIPEEEAVNELINLIKENKDWKDPE